MRPGSPCWSESDACFPGAGGFLKKIGGVCGQVMVHLLDQYGLVAAVRPAHPPSGDAQVVFTHRSDTAPPAM
jgi:hypothetical protein